MLTYDRTSLQYRDGLHLRHLSLVRHMATKFEESRESGSLRDAQLGHGVSLATNRTDYQHQTFLLIHKTALPLLPL